ncbi:MAG: SH3 domain-containing protein, partial [Spirulina sp. SIO3F2]|nr:SH3 domain-containing protein [Spirulina sp. SIO3F2]
PAKGQDEQQTPATESNQAGGKPDPKPSPKAEAEPLEPGAYRARVTWPDGLSLRDEPSLDANRIESILYDQEMIVLRSTDDGVWDRVRLPGSNKEGWVKAGNAQRIEED